MDEVTRASAPDAGAEAAANTGAAAEPPAGTVSRSSPASAGRPDGDAGPKRPAQPVKQSGPGPAAETPAPEKPGQTAPAPAPSTTLAKPGAKAAKPQPGPKPAPDGGLPGGRRDAPAATPSAQTAKSQAGPRAAPNRNPAAARPPKPTPADAAASCGAAAAAGKVGAPSPPGPDKKAGALPVGPESEPRPAGGSGRASVAATPPAGSARANPADIPECAAAAASGDPDPEAGDESATRPQEPAQARQPSGSPPAPAQPNPRPPSPPATRVVHPLTESEAPAFHYPRLSVDTGMVPAGLKARHHLLVLSLVFLVLLPTAIVGFYLFAIAHDQYHSIVSFSVRSEEMPTSGDFLGAITRAGSNGASDSEIIREFLESQTVVQIVDRQLDLKSIYNIPEDDWYFRLGEDPSIEDMVDYWLEMVDVSFPGAEIIEVKVRAFTPDDAQAIAEVVLAESTRLVNELSTQARRDAVAYARDELAQAEDRLRGIRANLRQFRDVEQQIDPSASAQAALGLVAELEVELAKAQVELGTIKGYLAENAPEIRLLKERIATLEERIAAERMRMGSGAGINQAGRAQELAEIVGTYEELLVDREFAEKAYTTALASYEQAQVEARRQHRYLAAHILPTLSEEPQYPRRWVITSVTLLFLAAFWGILMMVFYSLRDRA